MDALAFAQVELEGVELSAGHLGREAGAVFGVFQGEETDAQRCWRRSSVTSPSIQRVGRRFNHVATPELNARTL